MAISLGESESDRREREEQELKEKEAEKRARITVKARENHVKAFYGDVEVLYPDSTNNCVAWAKSQTGINRTMGAGGRSAIQGQEPKVGAIGVLSGVPHAVVVESIDGEYIAFRESNYRKGQITRRILTKSNFLGYIYN